MSIEADSLKRSRKALGVSIIAGGDQAPHAFHVETGTSDTPAVPFLRSAWDQNLPTLERNLAAAFEEGLREAWTR